MISRRQARPFVFTAVASSALTLGVMFAYVVPASSINPAPAADRAAVASPSLLRPWSEDLSAGAVDAGGIERDLDSNSASLFPSDQWCGRPACVDPRL